MASGSTSIEMGPVDSQQDKDGFSFTNFLDARRDEPNFSDKPLPTNAAISRRPTSDGKEPVLPLWQRLPSWIPIVCWIIPSISVILQNKYILTTLKFSHPIALTTIHLLLATVATRLLRKFTHLVDGAKEAEAQGKMNRQVFIRKIVPVGVLFSASLVLGNWVYLRLAVSFIQMLKAFTPVAVLLISFAARIKEPSQKLFIIVGTISLGVAIASYGEIEFELIGFLVQILAIVIEASRLVLIQIFLKDLGLDPLSSLYYFAPVCLAVNLVILLPIEGFQPFKDAVYLVGIPTLFGNACTTFALNLSSVWLIGKASGLVLTLAGVGKDILLIAGAWLLMGSSVTVIQLFGYAVALGGLVAFKLG